MGTIEQANTLPRDGTPQAGRPAGRVPTVLFIEDDPDLCRLLTDALREAGYHVLTAHTAIAGLALARDRQPDLIVLDLRLPDLDGLTLLGQLHADPGTARLPVFVLSSYFDPSVREICRTAGVRAYLSKPPDPRELLELVRAHVGPPPAGEQAARYRQFGWESAIVQGISRLVHAELDAARVCQAVVDGAQQLLGLKAASLWLLDGEDLELRVQSSLFESRRPLYQRIPLSDDGLLATVARERRPLTTDAATDPRIRTRQTFEALGLRAYVGVPLLHGGRLLGVLSGARASTRPFEAEDIQMLEALAEHAAAVLAQARLLQESERRRQTAEALAALAAELSASHPLDAVLDRVLDYAQQLVAADLTCLAVQDPGAGATPLLSLRGACVRILGERTPKLEGGIVGWVLARGEPFRTADCRRDPRLAAQPEPLATVEGVRAVLAVPIRLNGRVVGVLGAMRREARGFSVEDERVLGQLAAQAAVALGNIWLYRQVAQAKQEWETTVNHMCEGLALVDAELRVLRFNRTLAGWTGRDPDTLVGQPLAAILPLYADPVGQARLARALAAGVAQTTTIEEPGSGRILEETLAPVAGADGRAAGLVVMLRDVTEARRREMQLAQTEKLAALGEMLAGVAHELNNPLTGVLGLAQLLEEREEEDSLRQDLERLAREAQRAARLVQRLLTFVHPSPPEHQPTDLNRVVQAALDLLEPACRADGIVLETQLDPALPTTWADPHQLQQVIVNLATNARQAMVSAGRTGRIRLTTRRVDGQLELAVSDQGPGIPPAVLPRIFDPFFTTKGPGEGTGLGLSLCHSIVTAHGGRIWAESPPGHGATLYVRLPIVPPPADAPRAADRPREPAGAERADPLG
ncbi:MAG TPA: GAF domain-containing protein, partial [Thermodesulfobacteriota bacterium]|nr:GAF domain-containing protein [Thermodesulfobacteriota bacterium]